MNERQFSIRVSLSEFHRIMAARTLKTDRQRRLNSLEVEENQQTKRKKPDELYVFSGFVMAFLAARNETRQLEDLTTCYFLFIFIVEHEGYRKYCFQNSRLTEAKSKL